jgi:hypothetical protein
LSIAFFYLSNLLIYVVNSAQIELHLPKFVDICAFPCVLFTNIVVYSELLGMDYLMGKRPYVGADIGKNLYLHAGMDFLAG